jgi:hypothetical protein
MKMIPNSRKRRYVARVGILLIVIALITGIIDFPADLGPAQPLEHALGIQRVAGAEVTTMAQSSENITTYDGDLIIDGYEEFVIENCTWIQKGNVYVRDMAKLIIRNCVFQDSQAYFGQYQIIIGDYARLVVENAQILSDKRLQSRATGHAEVAIEDAVAHWDLSCEAESRIKVTGTTMDQITAASASSRTSVSNSSVDTIFLYYSEPYTITIDNLKPNYYKSLQLQVGPNLFLTLEDTSVKNWQISVLGNATVTVADSEFSFVDLCFHNYGAYPSAGDLDGIKPGLYGSWSLRGNQSVQNIRYDLTLRNTTVHQWMIGVWDNSQANIANTVAHVYSFGRGEVNVENSTVMHLHVMDEAEVTLTDSKIKDLLSFRHYHGRLVLRDTTADIQQCVVGDSSFHIDGELAFARHSQPIALDWSSSDATRNFSVAIKNKDNSPVANASLTLLDRDNTLLWHGTTDSMGKASFNITFTDSNYTDTLRLEAVKGDLSAKQSITLLSNTPVVLTLLAQYSLNVSSTVGGWVTTPGGGTFTCGEGTVVQLGAYAEEGYHFLNWTGDVATVADVNAASTTITMNGNYSITANFEEEEPPAPPQTGCFIATAAYGTPMAEEIQILRRFRDEYLLTNSLRRTLVGLYYKVSPPIAEFITDHPSLKPIVRAELLPIVVISKVIFDIVPQFAGNEA